MLVDHDNFGLVVRLGACEDSGTLQKLFFEFGDILNLALKEFIEGVAGDT